MPVAIESVNPFCGCVAVRKVRFHLDDCGSRVSVPLQHNLTGQILHISYCLVIQCSPIELSMEDTYRSRL